MQIIIKPIIESSAACLLDDDEDEEKVQMKIKHSKVYLF